jgi:hypothetical protein
MVRLFTTIDVVANAVDEELAFQRGDAVLGSRRAATCGVLG